MSVGHGMIGIITPTCSGATLVSVAAEITALPSRANGCLFIFARTDASLRG
jgi:hypothetical protein